MVNLDEDLYRQIIFLAGQSSRDSSRRDQICIDILRTCCLVSRTWRRLAQPILEQTIVLDNGDQLEKRLLNRSKKELRLLRDLVIRQPGGGHWEMDVQAILNAIPTEKLRSLLFFEDAGRYRSPPFDDRSVIGTAVYTPPPLKHDLSSLREALLCNIHGGSSWLPLLQVTPALKDLTFYHAGWSGRSEYQGSPSYLPTQPPPFSLRRFEIFRSHIQPEPLRWALSKSVDTLTHVNIRFLQREWDTFITISALREQGQLPNVTHLTIESSEDRCKNFDWHLSDPLSKWSGIKTVYMFGDDSKCRGAIVHGLSELHPIPHIEMGVGDMRLHEFRALFRLRKGKFQRNTRLRLVTKAPRWRARGGGGYIHWDWEAPAYWEEMEEDAVEIAAKHGVVLELASTSLYA
ncbi:hypothetical protein LTR78_001601 [Recurvomyces mirabilis]|uniref:Uncharacterized protein n=1 Tax=Recurvomyces mirabilis TaxID=574656 RepID=A0AAE1C530_9PEZI|nr:hypothetical protein LTR78_001601 [Recurvomyces mirabilis]KAK5151827.1 hypothetical protein LTS14_008961 [Recurvomyces mirabilis]